MDVNITKNLYERGFTECRPIFTLDDAEYIAEEFLEIYRKNEEINRSEIVERLLKRSSSLG